MATSGSFEAVFGDRLAAVLVSFEICLWRKDEVGLEMVLKKIPSDFGKHAPMFLKCALRVLNVISLAVQMPGTFADGDELDRGLVRLYVSARCTRFVFDVSNGTFSKTGDFTTAGCGVRAEYTSKSHAFSIKVLGHGHAPPLCLSRVWETEAASDLTWATSLDCTRIKLAWSESVCEEILDFTAWAHLARRTTVGTALRCGAPSRFVESWAEKNHRK
jgi:hypothetical protein